MNTQIMVALAIVALAGAFIATAVGTVFYHCDIVKVVTQSPQYIKDSFGNPFLMTPEQSYTYTDCHYGVS